MNTIALFPGLDGSGELYQPLIQQLDKFDCQIFPYPKTLIEPKEIASYLAKNKGFSEIDLLVAESFGCRVLYELFQQESIEIKPSVFIAGFTSISARYKLLVHCPDFLLRAFYKKAANRFVLNRYCLGNTKDKSLVAHLQEVLVSVPYETVIGRLRYLARKEFEKKDFTLSNSTFLLANRDKLLSRQQQIKFIEVLNGQNIVEIDGPHFLAQTRPGEVASVIRDIFRNS